MQLLVVLAAVFCGSLGSCNGAEPLKHNITVIHSELGNTALGAPGECVSEEERQRALVAVDQSLRPLLLKYLGESSSAANSQPSSGPCSGPGWRRIADYDLSGSNSATTCPLGLSLTSYTRRTCGRGRSGLGCSSTTFSAGDSEYRQVCGRIRGYQVGLSIPFHQTRPLQNTYVNGVSLTHGNGNNMQHVWTFAFGSSCPCEAVGSDGDREEEEDRSSSNSEDNDSEGSDVTEERERAAPSFVRSDYFCEHRSSSTNTLYEDDPLWDGQGCSSTSTCCEFNNPPWFTKNLPNPTTDDIELRLCNMNRNTGTPIDLIELYVK